MIELLQTQAHTHLHTRQTICVQWIRLSTTICITPHNSQNQASTNYWHFATSPLKCTICSNCYDAWNISDLPLRPYTNCLFSWKDQCAFKNQADLICYVWHLKHAVEWTFTAPLGILAHCFCPSLLPVVADSVVEPVKGNVRAPHCCCNATHLWVSGVNWSGVFV